MLQGCTLPTTSTCQGARLCLSRVPGHVPHCATTMRSSTSSGYATLHRHQQDTDKGLFTYIFRWSVTQGFTVLMCPALLAPHQNFQEISSATGLPRMNKVALIPSDAVSAQTSSKIVEMAPRLRTRAYNLSPLGSWQHLLNPNAKYYIIATSGFVIWGRGLTPPSSSDSYAVHVGM